MLFRQSKASAQQEEEEVIALKSLAGSSIQKKGAASNNVQEPAPWMAQVVVIYLVAKMASTKST
jgi:hypothetical protein